MYCSSNFDGCYLSPPLIRTASKRSSTHPISHPALTYYLQTILPHQAHPFKNDPPLQNPQHPRNPFTRARVSQPYSTLLILPTLLHTYLTNTTNRCYSAQEHSSHLQQTSSPSLLPADIILETLLSVITLCLGLVLGSPPLRPISWRVWAGKIENGGSGTGGEAEANPFLALESRVGFWDVRVCLMCAFDMNEGR